MLLVRSFENKILQDSPLFPRRRDVHRKRQNVRQRLLELHSRPRNEGALPGISTFPENAFPAPVEDCLSAYMHLIQKSGRSPRDIIFFSRSAGSALAASVMLILRDRGLPLPAAALLLSPFTNLKCDFDSFTRNKANDRMLSPEITIFLRDVTMETCDLRIEDPLVSPEFGNLEGLPRLFVQAGTHEIIEDCAIEFAKKAISAGVDCELSLVERGFHGGELLTEVIPEGREQFRRSCAFIERVQREDEEEERVCETVG
eukprot:188557_1